METRTYSYEAMFLLSQSQAVDLTGAVEHINEVLTKGKAEILAMKKWDERRLAYEIDKQKRGVYILAYFTAPHTSMAQIERDFRLSEKVLRTLILRCDHLGVDEMRAADARDALAIEAKMRASRPADQPQENAPAAASETAPTA